MQNFFISYTRADLEWATWIAWHLREGGHPVEMQDWHFRDGPPVVEQINTALANAHTTIAVLSPEYFDSKWCKVEWQAAFSLELEGKGHRLLAVQIKAGDLPPVLLPNARVTLHKLNEAQARERLLQAVAGPKGPPLTAPAFPVTITKPVVAPARPPGMLPDVWNIPHERNRNFTGRVELLQQMRQALTSGLPAALVQALHGLGGIGKTQLAIEYAYRHVGDYNVVWWVRAEEPLTRTGDLAALAGALKLPEGNAQDQRIAVEAAKAWLSRHSGWLLVLDNVPHPSDLVGLLPQGTNGHILITSRDPNWLDRATPLKVDVFPRPVSVEFLLKRAGPSVPSAGGPGNGCDLTAAAGPTPQTPPPP
ncbi:MAG: toll/interleukin-1 receptor domain-containing protein, partial [Planctomycetota bacterium]